MESNPAAARRERRLAARAERERIAASNKKKTAIRKRLTLGGIVAVVVVVLALLAGAAQEGMKPAPGRTFPDEGNSHVNPGTPLIYKTNPPTSGQHYPTWARPGFYSEAVDKGLWVHSMEHGYVIVLYNCPTDCPEITSQLKQFYDTAAKSRYGYQKLIVTPYPEMDHKIATVAWTHLDEMDEVDLKRIGDFYRKYMDHGPEDAG